MSNDRGSGHPVDVIQQNTQKRLILCTISPQQSSYFAGQLMVISRSDSNPEEYELHFLGNCSCIALQPYIHAYIWTIWPNANNIKPNVNLIRKVDLAQLTIQVCPVHYLRVDRHLDKFLLAHLPASP